MGQETLVFIDDNDRMNATITAKSYAHNDIRNRAYFNAIGASLISKYLASENINTDNVTGLHSIKKVLEEVDVSDIILPNIHIDVRVIFDENIIFIPKSHFDYNILPDIYIAVKPSNDLSNVEILGFFEPSLINKNNANNKYYFIEKEKLSSVENLLEYIKNHKGSDNQEISSEELDASEQFIMAFSDNDISEDEKKYLIQQLYRSSILREKYIEYENFETLSYKAMTDPMIDVPGLPQDTVAVDEFDIFDDEFSSENNDDIDFDSIIKTEDFENSDVELSQESETESASEQEQNDGNTDNVLGNIDVLDENILTDVSELANLSGAIEGFGAVETVSDTMEDILFDDETVQAIDNIDAIKSENADEISVEPIEQEQTETNSVEEQIVQNTVDDAVIDDINAIPLDDKMSIPEEIDNFDSDVSIDNIEPLDMELTEENMVDDTLSLDTIEPPEMDIPQENVSDDDNKLSFDTIIPSEIEVNEENVVEDENKLSFDTIIPSEIEVNEENVIEDENKLSFDTIIPSEIEANEENVVEDENKLSFDTIIPSETETSDEDNANENLLSFDTVEAPQTDIEEDIKQEDMNLLSFDDIVAPGTKTETLENNSQESTELEPTEVPFIDNIDNIDTVDYVDSEPADNNMSEEAVEEENPVSDNSLVDIKLAEDSIVSDENLESEVNIKQSGESFGKNLLENLNEESLNNVVIEGVEDNNISENIPSEELLSQIDDVLSSSSQINSEQETEHSFVITHDVYEELNGEKTEEDKLDVLYNEQAVSNTENNLEEISEYEEIQPTEQEIPLQTASDKQSKTANKKTLVAAVVLVVIFAGLSAMTYFKPKNNSVSDVEKTPNNTETITNEINNPTNNILESNAPQEVNTEQVQKIDKSTVQEMKNTNKAPASGASMNVTKLVWDAPASVASNPQMQTYLKSVGKSIKLSLSTDLLLASEYAYTNLVKVNITLSANGNAENVSIASGSGSSEIDRIVLQSVNDTMRALKPSPQALLGQSQQLTLIIYF